MTKPVSDRHRLASELFHAALERSGEARERYLDEACNGDESLRSVVDRMLRADEAGEAYWARWEDSPGLPRRRGSWCDRRLGPYRLVQKIGEGGASVVYQGIRDDGEYAQRVAVKLLRVGVDGDEMENRLRRERQILAVLGHRNIAKLLDGGTTREGVPYLVMEYVEGSPIDRYCEAKELGVRQRLKLFLELCAAVEHAHRNLVVHRDLKPSNVLVDSFGEPKLLDFGIAKLLSADLAAGSAEPTRFDVRLMTPEYASPEQVRGEAITTSSDVYSLGVLLYRLLAGEPPYKAESAGVAALARAVCEEEPECPSSRTARSGRRRRAKDLRGDLDNIVLAALAKEPTRRYASVAALAADLRRHLDGLPVRTRKATWAYRTAKLVRRHPLRASLAAVVCTLGLAFVTGMAAQSIRVRGALREAEAAQREAEEEAAKAQAIHTFMLDALGAADPEEGVGREVTVLEALGVATERVEERLRGEPEIAAAVKETIGKTYLDLGRYEEAEALFRSALSTVQENAVEDDAQVARVFLGLGSIQLDQGDIEEAERIFQKTLEALYRSRERESLEVAQTLNELGNCALSRGRLEEALGNFEEAFLLRRKVLRDVDDPALSESLHNLGVVHYELGMASEAESLFRSAIAMDRRLHGRDHALVALGLANLSTLLWEKGDLETGAQIAREALNSTIRAFGLKSREGAYALRGLSQFLIENESLAEAEEAVTRSLATARELYPEDHPEVGASYHRLGLLRLAQSKYSDASLALQKARAVRRRQYGESSWPLAISDNKLALAAAGMGHQKRAEVLFRRSLRVFSSTLRDHWRTARAKSEYGEFLFSHGRLTEAEPLLREGAARLEAHLGPEHRFTEAALERLARFEAETAAEAPSVVAQAAAPP